MRVALLFHGVLPVERYGGTGRVVGPIYAGWAFDHLGHGVPFYTGAAIVMLTITIGSGLEQFVPPRKT